MNPNNRAGRWPNRRSDSPPLERDPMACMSEPSLTLPGSRLALRILGWRQASPLVGCTVSADAQAVASARHPSRPGYFDSPIVNRT